jgi:endonuclease YncB( thermonuclease family)
MLYAMSRRARLFLLCAMLAGALAATGWFIDRQTAAIVGSARVIDGDSLIVAGTEVRLYGIDAPERGQTCMRAGIDWNCGAEAAAALRSAAAGREVVCRQRDRDRYGRIVAVCTAAGVDLGAAMVKGGLAVALGAYAADEREARDARRGLWSSSFDRPSAWRAKHPRVTP